MTERPLDFREVVVGGVDALDIVRVLQVDADGCVILSESDVDRIARAVSRRLRDEPEPEENG